MSSAPVPGLNYQQLLQQLLVVHESRACAYTVAPSAPMPVLTHQELLRQVWALQQYIPET
jgi:hypothetical protein